MTLTLARIHEILIENNLLKEYIHQETWHLAPEFLPEKTFTNVTYDSRKTAGDTLFFVKGLNFKTDYLAQAVADGLEFYVAEQPYDVSACGIIVTDIREAMALLGMAFYDYPQKKLKIVAFTGTKGKTTAAYFTKAILDQSTNQKTALFSTMNTTLDGVTYFKSHLTTPESLDLYRMMQEAVNNGMTHLVMEVSSQAYKIKRVYGLNFDVGIFLNIAPDHISPIEHPTFDDYFYCKRQLIEHSQTMIVNRETDYFELIQENCALAKTPMITYGRHEADYLVQNGPEDSQEFLLTSTADRFQLNGAYQIQLAGDFNQENAASALLASALVGATRKDGETGLAHARVPGRMDQLTNKNGANVYVDYAHNYLSLSTLLKFAKKEHPAGRVIVVTGSTGGKAISRRKDFGQAISESADIAILTLDDPAHEDPQKIAEEIAAAVTNPAVEIHYEMDRPKAIELALHLSNPEDSVIIAGKGVDLYQKIGNEDTPYEGDYFIAKRLTEN